MRNLIFGVCLALLVSSSAWAKDTNTIRAEVLLKTTTSWDGEALPAYPDGKPEVTISKFTIPPHSQLPMHKHPVINAGILLKGELTVITESEEVLHMKAGELLSEVVNTWHYGKNEGDEPVEIMVFYAGIQDEPITIIKK